MGDQVSNLMEDLAFLVESREIRHGGDRPTKA
jgi:hypothetical protein